MSHARRIDIMYNIRIYNQMDFRKQHESRYITAGTVAGRVKV